MPEIEITEDQYEYLQALQEDIQTQVVGKYAHVRTVDALQYLIDNHEGEIHATVPESADGSGTSGAVSAADVAGDAGGVGGDADADEATDGGAAAAATDDRGEDESDQTADEGTVEAADDAPGPSAPVAAAGGDDGMLSAMMALMDTHDDKWEKASGDTGYQVELPDGSTESANTQDDVRALLFKHYE